MSILSKVMGLACAIAIFLASSGHVVIVEAAFFLAGGCCSAKNTIALGSAGRASTLRTTTTTQLFSTPPPPRQPRRMLKKKRGRREGQSISPQDAFPWDTAESRPLVPSVSKEAGEDYWMDEQELEKELLRQESIANRKAMEGEVPKEKLWSEVKAPYKQNWIGIVTVMILILSVIGSQFPELLENPIIPIPDL
jgi:hypothetical protein